jgi:hypothetical protein
MAVMVTANFSACVTNLSGRGTAGNSLSPPRVDLTWTASGADHANVFRGAASGGPYAPVRTSTTTSFSDTSAGLANNTQAFYVLRLIAASGAEICRSNEAVATIPRGR